MTLGNDKRTRTVLANANDRGRGIFVKLPAAIPVLPLIRCRDRDYIISAYYVITLTRQRL